MPYHVRITTRSSKSSGPEDELALDLTEDELDERFIKPYRRGLPITTRGKTIPLGDIERLHVNYTDEPSNVLIPRIRERLRAQDARSGVVFLGGPGADWYVTSEGKDLTDEIITGPPGTETANEKRAAVERREEQRQDDRSRRVMVVHGRDLPRSGLPSQMPTAGGSVRPTTKRRVQRIRARSQTRTRPASIR